MYNQFLYDIKLIKFKFNFIKIYFYKKYICHFCILVIHRHQYHRYSILHHV